MTVQVNRKVGWGFWLNWTVLSSMSWLGGYVIYIIGRKSFGLPTASSSLVSNKLSNGLVIGLLVGGLIGFLAGMELTYFLIRYGYSTRRLTWITVGGGVIGFIGVASFTESESTVILILAIGSIVGVIVGIVQWLRLRRWFYQAGWWIMASAVAWAFGFATVFATKSGLLGAVLPLIAGAATGLAMMWLLNHPKQQIVNG